MTSARRSARLLAGALLMLAALLVAACTSSAAPSSAAPTAAATAAASAQAPTPAPTPSATPTPTPTQTATPEPTPSPTASPASSVGMTLAKGWQKVELSEAALKAQIKALQASNPQMAATLQQALDTGAFKNMKFYALGFSGATPIGNINVIELLLGGASLEAVQPVVEAEFKQLGATGITSRQASIAGVMSLIVDYKIVFKTGTSSTSMTGRAYLVPHDDVAYDATVTCYGSKPSACLAAGDKMVNTMKVTP